MAYIKTVGARGEMTAQYYGQTALVQQIVRYSYGDSYGLVMPHIGMAYIVMAHIGMAYIAMAYIGTAYTGMAYIVMAYIAMAYIVMADIVMAYIVMAYIVMAYMSIRRNLLLQLWSIVMAYIVMTYIVMAYIVMAYMVIACPAHTPQTVPSRLPVCGRAGVCLSVRACNCSFDAHMGLATTPIYLSHDGYMHARTPARPHTRTHARTHARPHTHTPARPHARTHARTYARTRARICACMHLHCVLARCRSRRRIFAAHRVAHLAAANPKGHVCRPCVSACVRACAYMHTCVCAYVHECMHVCVHSCESMHSQAQAHARTPMHTWRYSECDKTGVIQRVS